MLVDEFGGKSVKDAEIIKHLSSQNEITSRFPYDKYEKTRKRIALLCGTSNRFDLISDTENRRLIPFDMVAIDRNLFNSIDKEQLFVQVHQMWMKDKTSFVLNEENVALLESETGKFYKTTSEQEYLSDERHFEKCSPEFGMTKSELKKALREVSGDYSVSLGYVSRALKKMDVESKYVKRKINGVHQGNQADLFGIRKVFDNSQN